MRARGHAAYVHCHVARILRVGVHCVFTRLPLAVFVRARANEIPRAHRFTFHGSRRLSRGRISSRVQITTLEILALYSELHNVGMHAGFQRVEFRGTQSPFRFLLYAQIRLKVVNNSDKRCRHESAVEEVSSIYIFPRSKSRKVPISFFSDKFNSHMPSFLLILYYFLLHHVRNVRILINEFNFVRIKFKRPRRGPRNNVYLALYHFFTCIIFQS